jgi:hypothetical protein
MSSARGLHLTLSAYRFGAGDPTTRLTSSGDGGEFWRATLTPDGPGTIRLRWPADGSSCAVAAWGPGGDWLAATAPALTGEHDGGHRFVDAHPAIMHAQHFHPDVRLGASGTLYHELIPVIIGQRVTAGEAIRSWHRVVRRLGEVAPGPDPSLRLPPEPGRLVDRAAWWYHPLGIEAKRAEALRTLGRHAGHLWAWARLPAEQCAAKLSLLRGIGPWTIGSALGPGIGDPDAVAVGDFHLKHHVSYALAGEPRGTDERMLELLEPYRGQRGRAVRLLGLGAARPPAFGPRQRILPMHAW